MDSYGTRFEKDGDVGIITIHPPTNGNSSDYDPKLAWQAIREEVRADESLKLIFIPGEGERRTLLREIFDADGEARKARIRRRRRQRKARIEITRAQGPRTHTGRLLFDREVARGQGSFFVTTNSNP